MADTTTAERFEKHKTEVLARNEQTMSGISVLPQEYLALMAATLMDAIRASEAYAK